MTSCSQEGFCDEIRRKCDDKGEGGIPKLCDVIYERSLRELKHFKSINALLVFEFDFTHCLWCLYQTTYFTEWYKATDCKCMQTIEIFLTNGSFQDGIKI